MNTIDIRTHINNFLTSIGKPHVVSDDQDLFDIMDSLDFIELITYLDEQGIKIELQVNGVHFNFNLIQTVERMTRYVKT